MTRSKHDTIYELTTSPKKDKLTIKNISPGCYMCVEEDLRPGMHSQGGTGYVIECISEKYLRNFTITYEIFSSSGVCVEANITHKSLTDLEYPLLSMSYLVQE